MKNKRNVSIAIPTYNSSKYLESCIKPILNSKYVDEIVICDDFSNSQNVENQINLINTLKEKTNIEIKSLFNKKNVGAFKNKYICINNCKNEIVYQIDSDNIPQKNIDQIFLKIIGLNEKNNLFLPSKIFQFRKNHKMAKNLSFFDSKYIVTFCKSDKLINLNSIQDFYKNKTPHTIDKNLGWVLNLGNFIVHKETYLNFFNDLIEIEDIPLAADALGISYFFIKNGGNIKLLENFYHFHRKREDSVSFTEGNNTDKSFDYFKNKFLNL